MTKFIRNILLFLLPVMLLLVILPVDQRIKYDGLKGDCASHGSWIYKRLYKNPNPVDIAFIGSSHTISGIDDRLINDQLADQDLHILNLGYCRLGRNMSYTLLQELLKKKKPKHIFLEVREDEDRYSHPIFPYLADTKEILLPQLWFNRDILADLSAHFTYKVELAQDYFYKSASSFKSPKGDYGFGTTDDSLTVEEVRIFQKDKARQQIQSENLERQFYMQFPRSYLQRINDLCQENSIQLHFLYLPSFGSALEKPYEFRTYEQLGLLYLPPKEIFENPNHWHDRDHLNPAGAKRLSLWLSEKIKKMDFQKSKGG